MKTMKMLAGCVAVLSMVVMGAQAQDRAKAEAKPVTPLTIQVVLTEYEGEKKVSSLPYSVPLNADDNGRFRGVRMRTGIQVPMTTGSDGRINYTDVGTNIECYAESTEGGLFKVNLVVSRSSIFTADREKGPGGTTAVPPMIRKFEGVFNLLMRDGQTIANTMATDPLNGRVLKLETTLRVVK